MAGKKLAVVPILFLCISSGCVTTPTPSSTTRVLDSPGKPTVYEDVGTSGSVQGIGVESQDIASMTDRMVRDMLATPSLAARQVAPYVIIDDEYFTNESASILNKRLITEKLMINLNRSAAGRMMFVERAAADMVEHERMLKREGVVNGATMGAAAAPAGADFRLTGRIMSQDARDPATGRLSRYHSITFKMVDLETGLVAWSNLYEFKKASTQSVVYR